jgi:hypothetical protein
LKPLLPCQLEVDNEARFGESISCVVLLFLELALQDSVCGEVQYRYILVALPGNVPLTCCELLLETGMGRWVTYFRYRGASIFWQMHGSSGHRTHIAATLSARLLSWECIQGRQHLKVSIRADILSERRTCRRPRHFGNPSRRSEDKLAKTLDRKARSTSRRA